MAERLETAELDEEVQEAGGRAVDSHVGHAVTPGAEGQADLVADEVGRVAQAAAEVVPHQPSLHAPEAVTLLAVHDAALVVLRQAAGPFFNDFGGGEAPAGDAAGGFVVGEEVAGYVPAPDGHTQVGDVVREVGVGFGEDAPQHDGGEAGVAVGLRVVGEGGSGEDDAGKQQRQQQSAEADWAQRESHRKRFPSTEAFWPE